MAPEDQFLNNVLLQELKVPREYSRTWVEHFRDAIQEAKLTVVRTDGKVQLVEQAVNSVSTPTGGIIAPNVLPLPPNTPPPAAQDDFSVAIPIALGKGRIAYLKLPDQWVAAKDLPRLLKMIQLSLSEDGLEDPAP